MSLNIGDLGVLALRHRDTEKGENHMALVRLYFEAEIDTEIDADPEDPEAWADGLERAYARLSVEEKIDALRLVKHDLIEDGA